MAQKNRADGLPQGSGLYWNGPYIYVKIWHEGKKRFQGSTGATDVQSALQFKDAKLTEILKAEDTTVELQKDITGNSLLDDYVARLERLENESGAYANSRNFERNSYKLSSRIDKNLRPFFGKLKPEQITTEILLAYLTKRKGQTAKISTTNTEFRILRAALKRGTKTTPRKVNPLHIPDFSEVINDKAEKKAAREGTITPAQYVLIMEHAPAHLKPVFCAIYYSGIRSKEIKWVRRDQVDFVAEEINLRKGETKDGDARVCGMNLHVKEILMAWEESTKQEHPNCKWFFHLNGQQLGSWVNAWNNTLQRAGLRVSVKESISTKLTVKEAEIEKLRKAGKTAEQIAKTLDRSVLTIETHFASINQKTRKGGAQKTVWKNLVKFHDTRRTSITTLDELGLDEKDIMANHGHKTVGMSRRYNQSKKAAGRVKDAQNKMLGIVVAKAQEIAPSAANGDWKAELKELKGMLDDGTFTPEEFAAEKARVLANR